MYNLSVLKSILAVYVSLLVIGCQPASNTKKQVHSLKEVPVAPSIDLKASTSYLETLASDAFQGRMPCTEGEEKTVDFLINTMKSFGVKPVNGSYTQEVGLLDIFGIPDKTMTIKHEKGTETLALSTDFMIHSERKQERVDVRDSELVFCGYGIVDPSRNWNDYEGVDLKGKTAVVFFNDPGYGSDDPTFFQGDTMTYFGRWDYKYDEADRAGADGLIIIHEKNMASYPWFVVESSWSGSQQALTEIERSNDCSIKGFITLDQGKSLFERSGMTIKEALKKARTPGFKAISLNQQVSMGLSSTLKECVSKNVIGMVEGSEYPNEYILYTAHWDHLGFGKVVKGDSIYNGALDNASGVATVLGIAKAFAEAKEKPKRSVAFLFVTAEEQGLLGSEFYIEKPVIPINKTICNLNMDGVNPAGKMKDLTIVGYGRSTMDVIAREEAANQGRYIHPDEDAEKGYYFRSDHFNFAKMGIPALYAEGKYDHAEKGKVYAKEFSETYTNERYHAPSDEYDPEEWNIGGMEQEGALYLNVGWRIAHSMEVPKWYSNSAFQRKK